MITTLLFALRSHSWIDTIPIRFWVRVEIISRIGSAIINWWTWWVTTMSLPFSMIRRIWLGLPYRFQWLFTISRLVFVINHDVGLLHTISFSTLKYALFRWTSWFLKLLSALYILLNHNFSFLIASRRSRPYRRSSIRRTAGWSLSATLLLVFALLSRAWFFTFASGWFDSDIIFTWILDMSGWFPIIRLLLIVISSRKRLTCRKVNLGKA